ncbi:MAG: UPF0272 protein Cgl2470/cg2715 [Candidatus Hydrogenedentota bacterium]
MKTLYFDCFSGAAGDMITGALIDLGADFDALMKAIDSLDIDGFTVTTERVKKKGVMATQFRVGLDPNQKQPHRHLHHVVAIIEKGTLPDAVKAASIETFRRIAVSEAEVHGTTIERVHFHEVGAIDSIIDVVSANFCLHQLGVNRVEASVLQVGGGTVKCAHGLMPVPAPATALLLKDIPHQGGDAALGELLTPTGAALLGQWCKRFGAMPAMNNTRVGYGSGEKDLPDRPNVVRATLGDSAGGRLATESIAVLDAHVDDMNPELIPGIVTTAMDQGALDAFLTPVLGKKGRPATLITVLCDPAKAETIARTMFQSSSTLGIRVREDRRWVLPRVWKIAATRYGEVRVKIGMLDDVPTVASPEFEDCKLRAEAAGVPVQTVYAEAVACAVRGELSNQAGDA